MIEADEANQMTVKAGDIAEFVRREPREGVERLSASSELHLVEVVAWAAKLGCLTNWDMGADTDPDAIDLQQDAENKLTTALNNLRLNQRVSDIPGLNQDGVMGAPFQFNEQPPDSDSTDFEWEPQDTDVMREMLLIHSRFCEAFAGMLERKR